MSDYLGRALKTKMVYFATFHRSGRIKQGKRHYLAQKHAANTIPIGEIEANKAIVVELCSRLRGGSDFVYQPTKAHKGGTRKHNHYIHGMYLHNGWCI